MKWFFGFAFAILVAASAVNGLPARSPNDDAEVVVVPLEKQNRFNTDPDFDDFEGVVDTGAFSPGFYSSYNPFNWNFGNFFGGFEDIFRRMREQIANSWATVPRPGSALWPDVDGDKGNTTSTVKIVDGHKVVINETTYVKKTDFGDSIYKVRIIDVQPTDEIDDQQKNTNINVGKPNVLNNRNDFDDTEAGKKPTTTENTQRDKELDAGSPEQLESSDVNDNEVLAKDIDEQQKESIIELHYKQPSQESEHHHQQEQLQQLQQLPLPLQYLHEQYQNANNAHPESMEELDVGHEHIPPISWESWDENEHHNHNYNDNSLDDYENVPIDLSNDIAINKMLADQGAPHNPDAEVFSVEELPSKIYENHYSSPKFETIK